MDRTLFQFLPGFRHILPAVAGVIGWAAALTASWAQEGTLPVSPPAPTVRDLQAGELGIAERCTVLEGRVSGLWDGLAGLVRDWAAKPEPDLPGVTEGFAEDLERLRLQASAKDSAVSTDIGNEVAALKTRIEALKAKLSSVPAETKKESELKVKELETRVGRLTTDLTTLGESCGRIRADLSKWKAEFDINIEIDGAEKARAVLRERAATTLETIAKARPKTGVVSSGPIGGSPRPGGVAGSAPVPVPVPAPMGTGSPTPDRTKPALKPWFPGMKGGEVTGPGSPPRAIGVGDLSKVSTRALRQMAEVEASRADPNQALLQAIQAELRRR